MKVLVTGAAGFIGSHLVEALLARGDEVLGVDNFDPYYPAADKRENLRVALSSERFRLVEADVADPADLSIALPSGSFDAVVHLAAKVGIRASFEDTIGYSRTNVLGTHTMLDVAREKRVRRFILASSSSVYGNAATLPFRESESVLEPISPYAATKRAAEVLCETQHQRSGGSMTCLRFFTVYGPRQRPDLAIRTFATRVAEGEPVVLYGDGSAQRDYTWIEDIISGVLATLDRRDRADDEFQIINLGSGRATSLRRVVELIGSALGRVPDIVETAVRRGDVTRTLADLAKARQLLGYEPQTSVEQGIPAFVQSCISSIPTPR